MRFFQRLSISRKILLGILPLFLIFISISVALQNHFQEQEMMEQAQMAAHASADIIKEALVNMMVNNLEVDESFLERVSQLQQFDTLHILINDLRLRDELLTPKRAERLETKHKTLRPHDEIEQRVLATGEPAFIRIGDRFRGVVPFNATSVCQKCHAVPVGYTLGATDLHISLEQISRVAEANWKRSLLIFVAFALLAVTLATIMFTRFVSGPVDVLVEATTEISGGNLDYRISESTGRYFSVAGSESQDELRFLAHRFDAMRESLKEKIDQLDLLNRSLTERNRQLEEALSHLRKAQEELMRSERLAVTGKMTAQLSHEINNPIHNVQSLLESVLRKLDGDVQTRELISVALDEVNRMATLTQQMLNFYRGSVAEVEHHPVDIEETFKDLLKSVEMTFQKSNITVHLDMPEGLPYVRGSRDKLKQVFLNLVMNARDAMPDGGHLRVRANRVPHGVCVEVEDTGIGIPHEHLGRIFDAFFTTKKEVSGVGLGLSVSYGIIQQHNGSINVRSDVGKGTIFTILLPADPVAHG